uniref:Uncharacterized protein n=1 Tax=Bubo bubo TaxID=30461 RepID=A0A8C0EIK0_BUBBB
MIPYFLFSLGTIRLGCGIPELDKFLKLGKVLLLLSVFSVVYNYSHLLPSFHSADVTLDSTTVNEDVFRDPTLKYCYLCFRAMFLLRDGYLWKYRSLRFKCPCESYKTHTMKIMTDAEKY